MRILLFLSLGFVLVGCSSTPPLCQIEGAEQVGFQMAMKGEVLSEKEVDRCSDETKNLIKKGYEGGRKRYCSVSTAEVRGMEDAINGKAKNFPEESYSICDQKDLFRDAYEKNFEQGLLVYCAPDKLAKLGFEQGNSGKPLSFIQSDYRVCGAEKLKAAQAAFEKGYQEGLQKLCSPEGVEKVAKLNAQETADQEFPSTLEACLKIYPDAKTLYPNVFKTARKHFVESYCSYQGGLALGRKDAEEGHVKRSGMMAFCDADVVAAFNEGYLQGWKESKDKLCDPQVAYSRGLSDAKADKPMRFTVPSECPVEYHTKMQKRYREGFLYASNQPQVVKPEKNSYEEVDTYSASDARKACRKAGFSSDACDGVTSVACIEKGFSPSKCKFKSNFIRAIDACLQKGFSPDKCKNVKDIDCIQEGKNPFVCGNLPTPSY